MKKVMFIVGAVSLVTAAPASAKWWDAGLWSGDQGCSNKISSTNRWFFLVGC